MDKLVSIRRVFLVAAGAVAFIILAAWLIPALGALLPRGWNVMRSETALVLILTAISLELSEPRHSRRSNRISQLLAVFVALVGAAILMEFAFHISLGIDTLLPCDLGTGDPLPGRPASQTAGAFLLLGISIILIPARNRIAVWTADVIAGALSLLVLVLVAGEIFDVVHIFNFSTRLHTSQQTLVCIVLLTLVALLRRAERGALSIFLGHGIGATAARVLAPVLIALPILREIGRARVIRAQVIPEHYATTLLVGIATTLSLILLLLLSWRISKMEIEIRDLSLRDELTGLYNLRGFSLLSEQALRIAQRTQLPVTVLFIDLDNLKQINDSLGHDAGSACLAEIAEILRETFRETDVLGRVGGDEFAVLCQGSHDAITIAVRRLKQASTLHNSASGRRFPISLSVGFVTSDEHARQSLKELMTAADKAMYEQKLRRKQDGSRSLPPTV